MNRLSQQILKRLRRAGSLGDTPLPDEFVAPAYEGYSLANVAPTVLRHFGIGGIRTPPLAAEVLGDELEGAAKLVVMLVDALGYLAMTEQMDVGPVPGFQTLASRGRFVPLTSVFPSTTATALSSLHTGLAPVGHGITGYRMYLPDRGCVVNMIRLSPEADERPNRLLEERGDARALLGAPTVHRLLTRAGVASYCLIHRALTHSGLSEMLYDGATEVIPFVNASDLFIQVHRLLKADPGEPSCVWLYVDTLDTIQHLYGTPGAELAGEVCNLGFSLQKELLAPLAQQAVSASFMLLADHGHVQVDEAHIIPLTTLRGLKDRMLVPPTGTSRAAYFHVRNGSVAEVQAALRRGLADRACVVKTETALAAGLWGSDREKAGFSGRVGDLLALMRGSQTLFYPYRRDARPSDLVGGRHGGLHEREMLVPFFTMGLGTGG